MLTRRWRMVASVVAISLLPPAVVAGAQDASDLEDARARIRQIASELETAEQQAASATADLADADARLAEIEAVVNDIALQVEQQEGRVAQARAEYDRLQTDYDEVLAAFQERTVELFKHAYGSDLDLVLSATDIQTAIDRSTLLQAMNRSDRATLEEVNAAQARAQTQQEVLAGEADRLEAMRTEQEIILAEVRGLRASRALAAASARAEVVELAAQKEDLEADAARIEELIRERQAPPPTISPPSVGGYVWPVCGRVTSEYGRRWGRLHAGLDIDDNVTSAIIAAKSGTVIFTGWSGGYGQMTLIDHGDGVVTAYAHQSEIIVSRGESVARGQRIGTIGTTGSSTGTHLHFETRVNGSAVNPRQFLSGGC